MAKVAPTSIKYIIKAKLTAKGLVEKPDVIGAVFGQTEGLLGADLDLRELQRSGRIGRIEVELRTVEGNSEGEIIIPSALDAAETALIAATLETIERVGPCVAEIKLVGVEDTRFTKREFLVSKAKDILKSMQEAGPPRLEEVSEQIRESVRVDEITEYQGTPAGPGLLEGDEIIVVEGRADVLLLLRYGIRNTVAVEGTSVPQPVVDLTRQKTVTVFVDGDRGGELIIREMLSKAQVDFIAQAPPGKEVEELSRKELVTALRDRVPAKAWLEQHDRRGFARSESPSKAEQPKEATMLEGAERAQEHGWERRGRRGGRRHRRFDDAPRESPRGFAREGFGEREFPPREGSGERRGFPREGFRERSRGFERELEEPLKLKPKERELFKRTLEELVGTRAACILDEDNELLGRVPVAELAGALHTVEHPHAVVFDGAMSADIAAAAHRKGVKLLVCMEREGSFPGVTVLTKAELE